ncbi:hypothetical protein G6F56_006095 [Rhizopus delemar]|uniref:Arrestin-like N-terminal domain-containing protein n=1 Tax=Rhizopus stolonifer TaxID=4846 RepID=A0A367IQB0_RHIST|nr:hypothetical protein G6F56_006095 [Rhizopus delemar]RCH79843.1 hypothetical protein CU098_002687 [Rhizopus stolonifer]
MLFAKSYYEHGSQDGDFTGDKDPNIQFEIFIYPQFRDDHDQVVCYPGSVVEGQIQINILVSMQVSQIKLAFKGAEKLNYAAMGWEKAKATDDRLFSVRRILWGSSSSSEVLEAGEYVFPFTCQMPLINFPPTFQNQFINIAYTLLVSLERPKQPIILSNPISLQFQPIIETMTTKNIEALVQSTQLTKHIAAQASVPRLAYGIHHDSSIPVTVRFFLENHNMKSLSHLHVYIERCTQINYKTYSRDKMTTAVSQELLHVYPTTVVNLKLLDQELLPTLVFSNHLKITYRLIVTVKIKQGLIHIKKKLFDEPLMLGNLSPGASAPSQLEAYTSVDDKLGAHSRPSFLKYEPFEGPDFLPTYNDYEELPPSYPNISRKST